MERIVTVSLQTPEQSSSEAHASMEELHRLVDTAGGRVVESVTQRLLEKEVMEGDELRTLLGFPPVPAEPTPSPATL